MSDYEHEFEEWAVDHSGDFKKMVIRNSSREVIAKFNLDPIEDWIRFDLKNRYTATFYYKDRRPYYVIMGPCEFKFCDTGVEVLVQDPCHICGSHCQNRRCIVCGRSVCGRDVDDADPDGKLPDHYGPCWAKDPEGKNPNVCRECGEPEQGTEREDLEQFFIDDHDYTTEELIELCEPTGEEEY